MIRSITFFFSLIFLFFNKPIYKLYSTENLSQTRALTSSKICYRPELDFLKLKLTLSNSLSNRLVRRGDFRCSYLLVRSYYTKLLRANFLKSTPAHLQPYILRNFDNKDFLLAYSQYQAMKDLDYALVWRGMQTNSLFNMITKRKRKKKKFHYSNRVFFIAPSKRLLFVWRWLAVIIRCSMVKGVKRKYPLIPSLENFLMAPRESQVLNDFKLQIYRLKLLRAI